MTAQIALHELRVMMRSPFAWVAAGMLQLLFGWLFLTAVERYMELQSSSQQIAASGLSSYLIVHFLAPVSVVFMVATPLLCMNLIAGEKQSNRYNFLLTLPLNASHFIIGKFIGATIFQYLIVGLSAVSLAILSFNIELDLSHLFTATAGLLLFVATTTALTILYSSLAKKPILAAFSSFITMALLWFAAASSANGVLQFASPSAHLHSFMQGLLDSRDVVYFICIITALLAVGIWRFDAQRTRKVWS